MEAEEQEAGQPSAKVEEEAEAIQDAAMVPEVEQEAGESVKNIEQAAPNKAETAPADAEENAAAPAEAPAEQGVGAESRQQEQPGNGQDAEVATADKTGTGAEESAAVHQTAAAIGQGDEDMPDAAEAAPAAQQGEPGTAADHEEDAEAPAKVLGRQGSARGRSQRGRGKKGGKGKSTLPKRRSARSQKLQDGGSSGDMAADVAEHAAPLKTRRSLRSRTTSSKIDPAEFAMEAEVDEDADASPAPGESPLAQQNGNAGSDPGSRGVSVPVGEADTSEAGAIENAHSGRKGQKATTSADAKTDSIAESDDSIPLAQLVDMSKKRPTASGLGDAAARKRHKSDAEPAAAKMGDAPATEKGGGPAVKRAKNAAPDQAPAESDAAPEQEAPGLHMTPAAAEGDAPSAEPAAALGGKAAQEGAQADGKKAPMSFSKAQRQAQQHKQKAAGQPKPHQKQRQPAASDLAQLKEEQEGRKQGEPSMDPATRHAKQISDELDKCFGEFAALQKKQAEVAQKVQSYLGHLDGMTFSIDQLRASMVGKAAKRISRWALEPTSQEAALHAKKLCDAWMKAMADKNKAQPASKAPAQPAKVTPQEQRAKQQGTPATEVKRSVTAIASASNGMIPRAGNAATSGQSREAGAGAAGPPASKKLQDAREWCSQHLSPTPTGNAVRDQGLLVLWSALMPHAELPPAEAARKLEAAVHAQYTRGNGDNATADPGAEYIRRLRVLWGWLSPDSKDASPQLKRMLLQGELPCEELASMDGQQLKALTEPAAAAAGAATAAATAPSLANGAPEAPNTGAQPHIEISPSNPTPEQGATAPAAPLAPPTETTAVSEAAQEQAQQQQISAERDDGVIDMDIEGVPRSPFAAVKLEHHLGVSAPAPEPQPSWDLKSEPSLHFWAGNAQQRQDPPGASQRVVASGAATSQTRADAGVQLPAASSQPPAPPAGAPDLAAALAPDVAPKQPSTAPAEAPDLAAAAAAGAPKMAAQQQPNLVPANAPDLATPAGSPGRGGETAVRGSQSAPPASQAKAVFDPDQAAKGYSRNAGVLFPWSTLDGDASVGAHGLQGSNVDACQPSSSAADEAQPMKMETDDVAVGE